MAQIGFRSLLAFFGCIVALHILVPEYEPARRYLSEYALSRWGPLMTVAFGALALGAWATGAALAEGAGSPARRTASICFRAYGILMAVAGIFPSFLVPPSFAPAGPLHNLAAQGAFLAVLAGLWCDAGDRRGWTVWILPAVATAALFHLMDQAINGGNAVGNAQRIYVLSTVGGMARIARRLHRDSFGGRRPIG
ncbi:MAG: DUF998 domain-containing protein [Armatimonadota bacterium]